MHDPNFSPYTESMLDIKALYQGQHLILTQGLPASGKTTWTNLLLDWAKDVGVSLVRINRDAIRLELGFKFDPKRENEVTAIQEGRIWWALAQGENVVCDDTYLNAKYVYQREEMADSFGKDIKLHLVDWFINSVSVEECIARDLKREAYVGKDVIERMYYYWWGNKTKPLNHGEHNAVICDLDGTLALFKGNPYDRDFMADEPNYAVVEVLRQLNYSGQQIIITSGRSAKYRTSTEAWLIKHDIPCDGLIMRKEGDSRRDTVVKKEMYMKSIQSRYRVLFVLDDRPSVVRMWRAELGLTVFQVGPNMEF